MKPYDLIIRGGTVIDGTGGGPAAADVAIRGDRIVAIGDLAAEPSSSTFDASGRRVAPGFIDIHTHSDMSVAFHPEQESVLSQGVTSQVVGNCSLCIAFATMDDVFAIEKRWTSAHGAKIVWDSFDEHLSFVEEKGVGTNYLMLAGQGTLRKRVMGMANRRPDKDEMAAMKGLLYDAFAAGAWGLSTGLEYTPSKYADISELAELARVAVEHDGIYASHLRNEGDRLEEAVAEAIEIGERAGAPVQLSHHKAEGRQNWGKVQRTLAMVEAARLRGVDVQLDQYPYTAFQTSMAVQFLPEWANSGDNAEVLSRLSDAKARAAILSDIRENHADWDDLMPGTPWEGVVIGVCRNDKSLAGRTLAEIARERDANPVETMLDIIVSEGNMVSAVNFAICEDDIAEVMRHPFTMIGSDAVGTAPRGKLGEDRVHPRSYGTFPRVLGRYVRELGVLTEADAVRKMTSMPADRLGLSDRGRLCVGNYADVVVYDPSTVGDMATFADAHRFSAGIEAVIVNGRIAWRDGGRVDTLAGRVLRKGH